MTQLPLIDLTPEELQAAREWCRLYGPSNCWAGTFGGVAATLLRLLDWYEAKGRD